MIGAESVKPYFDPDWPGLNALRSKATVTPFEQIGDDRGTTIPVTDGLAGQLFSPDLASPGFKSVLTDHGPR